jgi:hypothetical protein
VLHQPSTAFVVDLRTLVLRNAPISDNTCPNVRLVVDGICHQMTWYRSTVAMGRAELPGAPQDKDYHRWLQGLIDHCLALEAILSDETQAPWGDIGVSRPQGLYGKVQDVVGELQFLRSRAETQLLCGTRKKGRPRDNSRLVLTYFVARIFDSVGISVTTTIDGPFAESIRLIFHELGLPPHDYHKAAREACAGYQAYFASSEPGQNDDDDSLVPEIAGRS